MVRLTKELYTADAIEMARTDALAWLEGNYEGWPRTWEQESVNASMRGEIYDRDFCAPPIAGYEALEADGKVKRTGESEVRNGQERARFVLRQALEAHHEQ